MGNCRLVKGKVYIYALCEQHFTELTPRYIGRAVCPSLRRAEHMKDGDNSRKVQWIQSLRKKRKTPLLMILECVEGGEAASLAELKWIQHFRKMGVQLVNGQH